MKADQLLYYSWIGKSSSGFKTYSKSMGITGDEEAEICETIRYVAPTGMQPFSYVVNRVIDMLSPESFPASGEYGIIPEIQKMIDDTFPVNYVYFVLRSGRYCYARATYCGLDYQKSRWANFVLHAYVTDQPYEGSVPMLFSCNPFKVRMSAADMSEQTPPEYLPEIDLKIGRVTSAKLSEMINKVGKENAARFALSLVKSTKSSLPILINAESEDILRYIAIAESVLPKTFTKDMTFSTYMYDDYNRDSFKIKHVFTEGAKEFDYAVRANSGGTMVIDFKNDHLTVGNESTEIFKALLGMELGSEASKKLSQMILDYYGVYGDVNGDEICRYQNLMEGRGLSSLSVEQLIEAVRGKLFELPAYKDFVRKIVLEALKQGRPVCDTALLIDFAYEKFAQYRESLVIMLVKVVSNAVEHGELQPAESVALLKKYCQGKAIEYYLTNFSELKQNITIEAQNVFANMMLKEAYHSCDKLLAEKTILIRLAERLKDNPLKAVELLSEISELVSVHRKGYSMLLSQELAMPLYEELVQYGVSISEKDAEFERLLCKLLVNSFAKKPLTEAFRINCQLGACAVQIYIKYAKDGEFGKICEDILWQLFEKNCPALQKEDVLKKLPDCFQSNIQRYLRFWNVLATKMNEQQLYNWFSQSIHKSANRDSVLSAMHKSGIHTLATRYIVDTVTDKDSFLSFISTWYRNELYTECFRVLAEKFNRTDKWNDEELIKRTMTEVADVFKKTEHAKDVEYFSKIVEKTSFTLMPQARNWRPMLLQLVPILKAQDIDIPLSYRFIVMAEANQIPRDLTQDYVTKFLSSISRSAYINYVYTYLEPLVDYLEECVPTEENEALLLLITGTSDARLEQAFAKQLLARKKDKSACACNALEIYFKIGKDAMRQAMLAMLTKLSVKEYIETEAQMNRRHNSKKLTELFETARSKFGFFKRHRMKRAIKKKEKAKNSKKKRK